MGMGATNALAIFLKYSAIACIAGVWLAMTLSIILSFWATVSVPSLESTIHGLAEEGMFDGCERCPRAFDDRSEALLTLFQTVVLRDSWGLYGVSLNEQSQGFMWITVLLLINIFVAITSVAIDVLWLVINWPIMNELRNSRDGGSIKNGQLRQLMLVALKGLGIASIASILLAILYAIILAFFASVSVAALNSTVKELAEMGYFEGCERCERAFEDRSAAMLTLFQTVIMGDGWAMYGEPICEKTQALVWITLFLQLSIFVVTCAVCMGVVRIAITWPIAKELQLPSRNQSPVNDPAQICNSA